MAAKSKKRLSKIEIKSLKLDNLELKDVLCSICQSILVEPVTLPCCHAFCYRCFNGSIENNALCCPLCRLRIGSWLRTSTKQKNLVNLELWQVIQTKFSHEILCKYKGEDIDVPEVKPILRLSAPGEIRQEYELELNRIRAEHLQLEQKHIEQTEQLIKRIQQEEEEAHKKYLEAVKADELIAQKMQNDLMSRRPPPTRRPICLRPNKPRLKDTKIDGYLSQARKLKTVTISESSPLLTDDNTNTSTDSSSKPNRGSPEIVPNHSKLIKNILDKKNKLLPGLWNKENGNRLLEKEQEKVSTKKSVPTEGSDSKAKVKNGIPSLVVSLPLPHSAVLQQKVNVLDNRKDAESVDSMKQELCYFKPIDEVTTSVTTKGLPLRVPGVRAARPQSPSLEPPPSRAQYLDGLCRLRHLSLARNLPSAFILALELFTVSKQMGSQGVNETCTSLKSKKKESTSPIVPSGSTRRNPNRNKQITQINGITKINKTCRMKRTRSVGSLTAKNENETTPKKSKQKGKKASSERKPHLRSDSKKSREDESPPLVSETLNNNKVKLAVKNLSSPLKNCDVKHILEEQLTIEKIIEQEKSDYELALKIEAEWNGRRARRAGKRPVPVDHALRPTKKLRV